MLLGMKAVPFFFFSFSLISEALTCTGPDTTGRGD